MRRIISACLVLSIVTWANVGWAQQRNGLRGRTGQQSRGYQCCGGRQQFQNQGSYQQNQSQAAFNQRRGQGGRGRQSLAAGTTVNGTLSTSDAQGLIAMRQEEKLARDVYLTLGEQWNLPILFKIAKAESRHMRAVGNLLARYSLPDPVANDIRGQFADQRFTLLYRDLVATGSQSAADALHVGVEVEELDIADLRAALSTVRQSDIRNVYQNLLKGSQQHLRAFTAQLK